MAIQNWIGGGAAAFLSETGISAAGTTQATATTLRAQDSEVTTVASGAGVVLNPLFAPSEEMTVFSTGANALKIYPPSGMQINNLPANTAMSLSPNTGVLFHCVSTTRIIGILSA